MGLIDYTPKNAKKHIPFLPLFYTYGTLNHKGLKLIARKSRRTAILYVRYYDDTYKYFCWKEVHEHLYKYFVPIKSMIIIKYKK